MDDRRARAPFAGLAVMAAGIMALIAVFYSLAPSWLTLLGMALLALGLYWAVPGTQAVSPAAAPGPAPETTHLPAVLRRVLESLDDPLLLLDSAGRITFANRAAEAAVGANTERRHISAALRNPDFLEAVDRVLAGGTPETIAFTMPVPVLRYFRAYIARDGEDEGSLFVLVHIRDLTAVRRSQELRADFLANASHELRTPLAALSGFIDTLKGHAKDDAAAREKFLGIMSIEAGRMRRLIDDLLSLSRIELNEHNRPQVSTDIVAIAQGAAAALAPLAKVDGIVLQIAAHDPLSVRGDRDELTQVLQNLLHNAIKYGRENSEVRVAFGRTAAQAAGGPGQVFVSIADRGDGIPREAIPRLTERFYRVDVKRSREKGGTGLGLAIVKHILNRHQGRLHIESTQGEGSTFTVYLPEGE